MADVVARPQSAAWHMILRVPCSSCSLRFNSPTVYPSGVHCGAVLVIAALVMPITFCVGLVVWAAYSLLSGVASKDPDGLLIYGLVGLVGACLSYFWLHEALWTVCPPQRMRYHSGHM